MCPNVVCLHLTIRKCLSVTLIYMFPFIPLHPMPFNHKSRIGGSNLLGICTCIIPPLIVCMYRHIMFLHLTIRKCLLITLSACAFSKCFFTSSHVLNIHSQLSHLLESPLRFCTCSATLCFFNFLFGVSSHAPRGPCKRIQKHTKTKQKRSNLRYSILLKLGMFCHLFKRLPGTLEYLKSFICLSSARTSLFTSNALHL